MTTLFAHRGYSVDERENTLAAYRAARDAGADWIELDVRRTADDVLVVHYDARLEDGRIIVELPADELPAEIPTLVDVFESCPDLGINVEIKNSPGDPDYDEGNIVAVAVAGLVAAYRTPEDILVTSFNPDSIAHIQSADPSIPVGLVSFDALDPLQLIERAVTRGHSAVNLFVALVSSRFMEAAHAAGISVNVWTVNERESIERMLDLDVDGVITDEVELARAIIDRR